MLLITIETHTYIQRKRGKGSIKIMIDRNERRNN